MVSAQEYESTRKCSPLKQIKNVEVSCYGENSGSKSVDCSRPQAIGTVGKYKCKQNHMPFDGSKPLSDHELNLTCGSKGIWSGLNAYDAFRCKEDCGTLQANSKPLVVHGMASNRSLVPWHATIFRNSGTTWTYICGGSIIRNQIVISAAHCFAMDLSRTQNPDEFRIVLGSVSSVYVENLMVDGVQVHKVQRIHISENYDPKKGYQADIAIIQLKDNIDFNENVNSVCLPNDYNTDLQAIRSKSVGKVAGFGITENGKISRTLRSLDLKIKSHAECHNSLGRVLSESQFCGGEKNGTQWETVCNGDSGGGLFVSSTVHQKYFIHGIVSSGDPNTDGGVCKNYAVFTRIYPFIFWIRDVIEEISGEIARDLRQNPPYPYALRGTETQPALFTGLPREWINRITSLEILYGTFSLDTMVETLENAKPIASITLKSILLTHLISSNKTVVLPVLSSFTLDTLWMTPPGVAAFDRISADRMFPVVVTAAYLRQLIFFDRDFETGEKFAIRFDTDIEVVVGIFRLIKVRAASGELTLQQTTLADSALEAAESNMDFRLTRLYLHRCPLDLRQLPNTLIELVLDQVTGIGYSKIRDLIGLKVLVMNDLRPNPREIKLAGLPLHLVHLCLSNIQLQSTKVTFENVRSFCCFNCSGSINFTSFPNLNSVVIISSNTREINLDSIQSQLTSIYLETDDTVGMGHILQQFRNSRAPLGLLKSILLQRSIASKPWRWSLPSTAQRQSLIYKCTKQEHFWTSEEDYLARCRLKSFEKAAWKTNVYRFVGADTPYGLESFKGIPASLQPRLKSIQLASIDITPMVLTEAMSQAASLKSLTLSNVTLDISDYKYEVIRFEKREFRLEKLDFRTFSFYYILEYVDSQLIAAVVPFQHIGRFKLDGLSNVLHHLFTNVNSIRLTRNDSLLYVLDTRLDEMRSFQGFYLELISNLPDGHLLNILSKALKERYELFQEGILPSTWEFRGLHVISQNLAKGFFRDDLLKVIGRTGILKFLLTRLGKFVTVQRSTSLTLLKKVKNPLRFPPIHAIAVNLNEGIIE